jgi:hypothetical protein
LKQYGYERRRGRRRLPSPKGPRPQTMWVAKKHFQEFDRKFFNQRNPALSDAKV